ncbi:hypothetical protein BCR34DRAFT_434299, partial [Clohesyomyces aquaticus]
FPPVPPNTTTSNTPSPIVNVYTKRVNFLRYFKHTHLLLHELQYCELLRTHPHLNLALYLGTQSRITGLVFTRYVGDLFILAEFGRLSSMNGVHCYNSIKAAMQRLRNLNMMHGDIKPGNNLMEHQGNFVLANFDSCHVLGEKLRGKAGTPGCLLEAEAASKEYDEFGLGRVK